MAKKKIETAFVKCGGTCASVCKANAISIKNGVAVVDGKLCKSCGLCEEGCPRGCITGPFTEL
ncbi:MAG: 4Fe-4S binding protein [Lachnospiraceae bacterium]|nr:4Fe-4S binding protein [Lachnospiraceae bacterium]